MIKNIVLFVLIFYEILIETRQSKTIYERDVSEYCRRRVIPSVFLGRKVMEANVRVLQFSRLELPYSCFIIIRGESGNNMVMMVQAISDVQKSCSGSEQLMVHEMGETFGGYWAALPQSALQRSTVLPQTYTLKTRHTTPKSSPEEDTKEPERLEGEELTQAPITSTAVPSLPLTDNNFVQIEIPIVNVSVHLVAVDENNTTVPFTEEESMDVVTGPEGEHSSKIVPIVQLSMMGNKRQYAKIADESHFDKQPKYNLDIIQDFTPDLRLTLPSIYISRESRRKNKKYKYKPTRRLNFKQQRTMFNIQRNSHRRTNYEEITKSHHLTKYGIPTTRKLLYKAKPNTEDAWQIIDLLKRLDESKESAKSALSLESSGIVKKLTNTNYNNSAYLSPNLYTLKKSAHKLPVSPRSPLIQTSLENKSTLGILDVNTREKLPTRYTIMQDVKITKSVANYSKSENESIQSLLQTDSISRNDASAKSLDYEKKTFKVLYIVTQTESVSVNHLTTETLVNHESWENVVKAAPKMVVLLNQSITDTKDKHSNDITQEIETEAAHKNELVKRKTRNIHSIAIEEARPHHLSSRVTLSTTTKHSFDLGDMQEFAQLVELHDDEMYGRIGLRYLRQFLGPPLFSLCSVDEPTKPHVYLFNSSRIVLSITNFTLERLVIIMTAARALRLGEVKCPESRLECQVAGARVCMDTLVACDGVPNCGSYDIYDEDRLLCGQSAFIQSSVYLAAFTFLALLLTAMYAVHYWLKRCVPRVAEAFFVYSDGTENVLYLNTIMRSPHDTNNDETTPDNPSDLNEDYVSDADIKQPQKSAWQRFIRFVCCCCFRRNKKTGEPAFYMTQNETNMPKKMYSFTEFEIRKMLTSSMDTAVQTGDSLQMNILPVRKDTNITPMSPEQVVTQAAAAYELSTGLTMKDSLLTLEEPLPELHKDELSILKFFKESRSDVVAAATKDPIQLPYKQPVPSKVNLHSEQEIEVHTYEPGPSNQRALEKDKVSSFGGVSKHLRFDEVATTISSMYDDDDEITKGTEERRGVGSNRNRRGSRPLDVIEETDELSGGTREQRYFWRSSKPKKPKRGHR